jgi:hypothetical protein
MPGKEALPAPGQSTGRSRFIGGLFLLTFLVCAGIGAAASLAPSPPPKEKQTGDYDLEANTFCERQVRERLKSPSSADFPFLDYVATHQGNDKYIVKSYVDAQNSFGATLRSDWVCVVQRRGYDNFELIDLAITAR